MFYAPTQQTDMLEDIFNSESSARVLSVPRTTSKLSRVVRESLRVLRPHFEIFDSRRVLRYYSVWQPLLRFVWGAQPRHYGTEFPNRPQTGTISAPEPKTHTHAHTRPPTVTTKRLRSLNLVGD